MNADKVINGSKLSLKKVQLTLTVHIKDDKQEFKDYNPSEHRNVPHPTSTIGSFFNLLKSSLGSGLLAMPAAFKHAGLIPGCLGTALVGFIATHCVHILVQTSNDLCRIQRISSLNYTDTCESAFKLGPKRARGYSKHVRNIVDFAMAGVCLGGTSVYVIFVASSLKDIFDHFYPASLLSVQIYCAFLLIPLILVTQIRYMKFLVPFSMFANFCLLTTFFITCYYTFGDMPTVSQDKFVADVKGWPLFLSTAIFAMEGINAVMPIENEMAHPQRFPAVLNTTMAVVALLYGIVGIFGYLKYGDDALGSVTLNLPQGDTLALLAKVLVALAVFFTYSLQMYAPMDIIWSRLQSKVSLKYQNCAQILLRTVSVIFTVTLAVVVPDLELLIGFVGSIFFSTLGLFIPVAAETVHRWNRDLGKHHIVLYKNGFLILFYVLVLVSGCYASFSEIVMRFS